MKFEYSIWNITDGWQPMDATDLDDAQQEIERMGPYGEEAILRDETGQIYKRNQQYRSSIHFGP